MGDAGGGSRRLRRGGTRASAPREARVAVTCRPGRRLRADALDVGAPRRAFVSPRPRRLIRLRKGRCPPSRRCGRHSTRRPCAGRPESRRLKPSLRPAPPIPPRQRSLLCTREPGRPRSPEWSRGNAGGGTRAPRREGISLGHAGVGTRQILRLRQQHREMGGGSPEGVRKPEREPERPRKRRGAEEGGRGGEKWMGDARRRREKRRREVAGGDGNSRAGGGAGAPGRGGASSRRRQPDTRTARRADGAGAPLPPWG